MSRTNNTPAVPAASTALNTFKMEVANELGITNYDQIDKGQLSSRQNGYVGGNMTKKMYSQLQHKSSIENRHYAGHIHTRTFNIRLAVLVENRLEKRAVDSITKLQNSAAQTMDRAQEYAR